MAESLDNTELLEVYKICRKSIEHFDKIMGSFRQTMFTFNGVFISTALAFYLNYLSLQAKDKASNEKIYAMLFMANAVLFSINLIVWLLEKHYHRYLLTTASMAKHIERKLFNSDKKKRLTFQLENCSKVWRIHYISSFIRSYDLIYLLPILGSICISYPLLNRSFLMKTYPNWEWLFKIAPLIFFVSFLSLIVFNYIFERKSKLNKT